MRFCDCEASVYITDWKFVEECRVPTLLRIVAVGCQLCRSEVDNMFVICAPEIDQPVEPSQTCITSFGSIYKRDSDGLLPECILEQLSRSAIVRQPRPVPELPGPMPSTPPVLSASGVAKWVSLTFVVGKLEGDAARLERDKAMLLGDFDSEGKVGYVRVTLGYETKTKAWIKQRLEGVSEPDEGPIAKRGSDGESKYVKLSPNEKQTAVEIFDALIKGGYGVRKAVKHMQENYQRFRNVSAASIKSWRSPGTAAEINNSEEEQPGPSNSVTRGAPPQVPEHVRQAIKDKVIKMCEDQQPMDSNVVSDVAIAMIRHMRQESILKEEGGRFSAGRSWCNKLLESCDLTRRKCTTQAQKVPDNWRALGHRLMLQV